MIEVEITPELICSMLTTGNEIHARIEDGLPEDADLVAISVEQRISNHSSVYLRFRQPGDDPEHPERDAINRTITVTDLRQEVDDLRSLNVRKLELKDGDTIIVETPRVLSDEVVARIKRNIEQNIKERLSIGVEVFVMEEGLRLEVVSK